MVTVKDIKAAIFRKIDSHKTAVKNILSVPGIKQLVYKDDSELSGIIRDLREEGFRSKEVIIFREFKGRIFQSCPGSRNVICCNYYLLNTSFDCLYNCTYCFLNSYLNSFGIVHFINIFDALDEIDFDSLAEEKGKIYRIGTGEYTDSLMMDEATGFSRELIERLLPYKNVMLELKTKSSNIDHLLDIGEKGNAVVSWSLNTGRYIGLYEEGTAGLSERIGAAARAQDAGFLLGFHFDPIILGEGDFQEYLEVVDALMGSVDGERIAWISLGCFRYSPGFKSIISENFPGEKLTLGEMFPGVDGKFRYLRKRRVEAYRSMKERIRSYSKTPFVYLCMETDDVWEEVFGWRPGSSEELEEAFTRHLKKSFSFPRKIY